jgi:hypothetical protein
VGNALAQLHSICTGLAQLHSIYTSQMYVCKYLKIAKFIKNNFKIQRKFWANSFWAAVNLSNAARLGIFTSATNSVPMLYFCIKKSQVQSSFIKDAFVNRS